MAQFIGKLNGAMALAAIVCEDETQKKLGEAYAKHVRYASMRFDSPFIPEEVKEEQYKFWDNCR